MKNIYKYAMIASAVLSLAACNNLIESSEPAVDIERAIILTATREGTNPNTRSVRMDDGTTWWGPKEEISVFYGSGSNGGSKFTSSNTTLAETTEFEGSISMSGNKEFWAVYPYSTENTCDGSSIVTVIPSKQTGSEGNFSGDAFPAIGKSSSLTMPFWNICGGIKFFVSRADIKSVTFKGNNGEVLAGKVRVTFGADGKPEVAEVIEGQTEVTLTAPDGGAFKAGKYYYMTLLPASLDGGFTMTFTAGIEKGILSSNNAQTIRRSLFGVLKNVDSKVAEWSDFISLKDFAQEFVKGLDVWKATIGNVDADGYRNQQSSVGAWVNVHFIPIVGNPEGTFYNFGNNQYDPKYTPWELNVNGIKYSSSEAWEIAIRGLMDMVTAEGNDFLAGMDKPSKPYTLQDGLTFSQVPIRTPSPDNKWGANPWYEDNNPVTYNGLPVSDVDINFLLKVCSWHVVRSLVKVVFEPFGVISNFVTLYADSRPNHLYLENYEGMISPMRELLILMRVYKYLLENNIDSNVYSAIKDKRFDFDLYGIVLPQVVDLGLSVKWASFNLGATKPEEYGDYYAWGETEPKSDYSWSTYKWCNGSPSTLTKYNTYSGYGTVDNKTVLDLEDDAAHVNWGGNWRMPTLAEQQELLDNCTWEWTNNYNGTGVSGRKVTSNKAGYTDKSIFLPVAGFTDGKDFSDTRTGGYYWCSSLGTGHSYNANHIHFYIGDCFYSASRRSCGRSVRPVYGEFVPVESISLNKISLDLYRGEVGQLTATISPSNATNKDVHWVSSDESVATVSEIGLVRAIAPGTATITAYASNGVSTACMVTVNKMDLSLPDAVDAVDLGLPSGLKWATMNVGATRPEQYGEWFAWGETEPKWEYDCSTYKFELGTDYNGPFSKYITKSNYGTVDNKTVLDPEDDAAHVNWGDSWRMPTYSEWKELIDNCTCTWTSDYNGTGVAGRIVTSNKSGYTDKSIFLPAAGYRFGTNLGNAWSYGFYWSSSLYTDDPCYAYRVSFYSDDVYYELSLRYDGFSIRPVSE